MLRRHVITRILLLLFFSETGFFLSSCQNNHSGSDTGNRQKEFSVSDSILHSRKFSKITNSIDKNPDSAHLYYERGSMLFVTKEYGLAKKDLQKAIVLNPLESTYYTALGQLFLSQNKIDSAKENFQKALHLDAANNRSRLQLAFILLHQKQYHASILQADTILKWKPQQTQAMGLQSQAYQALGDTAKALKIMKKVVHHPHPGYEALMAMGDLLMNQNNPNALSYYKQAAKKDTTAAEPHYGIGLYYKKHKQYNKAILAFNSCIETDAYYFKAYLEAGKLYEQTGRWEKAREIFNLAIRISPTNSQAYYHRGLANEKLKHKKAAIRDFNQALIFDEHNQKAQAELQHLKQHSYTF